MKKSSKNKLVMFAASQGGHFTELMGLKSLFGLYDSVLVTSNLKASGNREELKSFKEIAYSAAMAERREKMAGTKIHSRWKSLFSYLKMFVECFRIYFRYKPAVIVSTGSYIAVPLFLCGKLFGSKTLYIESNAKVYTKSSTGKLVEKLSDKIYVQWPEMQSVYPQAEYHGVLH